MNDNITDCFQIQDVRWKKKKKGNQQFVNKVKRKPKKRHSLAPNIIPKKSQTKKMKKPHKVKYLDTETDEVKETSKKPKGATL